jgi:RimJ/RimL family protein N-acetyltransferase
MLCTYIKALTFFLAMNVMAACEDSMLKTHPPLKLMEDAVLIPYGQSERHKAFDLKLFNDPTVYPHMLDGKPWTPAVAERSHNYILRLAAALEANGFSNVYAKKEDMIFIWHLEVKGEIVGRGGLFWDAGDVRIPEIFMYLPQSHQKKGLGVLSANAIIRWYAETIFPITHQPLRILAKEDNLFVIKAAPSIGFKALLDSAGLQLTTTQEGLTYLVFQRDFESQK